MISTLALSIGIGLVVTLLLSETFGIAAGGMVVPGYFALNLTKPVDVALTLGTAVATFAVVHALSNVAIVYGRRRTVLMILVGYLLGALVRTYVAGAIPTEHGIEYSVIGYVVPGLIAIWIDRQGLVETFGALLTTSVIVRLVLVLLIGTELPS